MLAFGLSTHTDDVFKLPIEYPDVSCITNIDLSDGRKNNKLWFELTELRVQFPLVHGNVVARIAPYEPNLRKVLEVCSEITPQTQLPESLGKAQGKPLTP